MTDITELALLVSKAKASVFTMEYISQFEPDDIDSDDVDLRLDVDGRDTGTNVSIVDECGQAAKVIGALVEALEKAQTINAAAEKLVRCKGRYHSEQNYRALAVLFGVKTQDLPPLEHENVHYADAAEMEIAALRQRIAELESRTVKLPDALLPATHKSGELFMTPDNVEQGGYLNRDDVLRVLRAAGIKVEAE